VSAEPVPVNGGIEAPAEPCLAAACVPLYDKVIIQLDPERSKTAGGLDIPDAHREAPSAGTVLAVGEGRLMEGGVAEPRLKVGQRVLVGKYGGIEIPTEYGERVKVCREDEVLLILPEGA
jgi:chaperonin GroES